MKKVLLLAAMVCVAITANAQAQKTISSTHANWEKNPIHINKQSVKAPAKKADLKDGEFIVGWYTDDSYSSDGLGFNGDITLEIGTEIPAEFYEGLEGFKVDGVRFAFCNTAQVKSVKLYGVTADDYITEALAVKDVNKTLSAGWNYVEFDEPVLVDQELKSLIPVYEFVNKSGAYAMAMNNLQGQGSFLAYGPLAQDGSMIWGDMGLDYGTPAIQMVCYADPVDGFNVKATKFTSTTVAMGESFSPVFTISSSSSEAVQSIDYTIGVGNEAPVVGSYSFRNPIAAGINQKADMTVQLSAPTYAGSIPVTFTVTGINGAQLDEPKESKFYQDVVTRIAPRMSVVEEFTGTGCGWCPRGWVGMEKVKHELSDKAAVIAIHQFNNTDPMYVTTYHTPPFAGAPGSMIDRKGDAEPYFGDDNKGIIATVKRYAQAIPEVVINVEAAWTDETRSKIDASAVTEFLTDLEGSELVFVLTADGLTGTTSAWKQGNYYASYSASQTGVSKTADPELYKFCQGQEWGQSSVTLVFNDVMIGSSWPSATKANTVAPFTTTAAGEKANSTCALTLPTKTALKNALLKDQIYVTAFVLKADGTIANAARCQVQDPTGINTVLAPASVSTSYDLNGRPASRNAQGIMIQNGKKVIR